MFGRKDRELEQLRVAVVQLEAYLKKYQEEVDRLKERLEVLEWRLRGLVKVFYPQKYTTGMSAEECIRVLCEELESSRIKSLKRPLFGEERVLGGESSERARVEVRLERLSREELEVLKRVLLGYCNYTTLVRRGGLEGVVERSRIKGVLEKLVSNGWLNILKVKRLRSRSTTEVYFPSPYGLIACEKILGRAWTYAQVEHLKELKEYRGHEELLSEVVERLRHTHKQITTDPRECIVRFEGVSHRADLKVDGVLVEVETLSNTIDDTEEMVKTIVGHQGELYVVVGGEMSRRMMEQRLCMCSWRLGYSIRYRISTVDRLSHLEEMEKYMVIRPEPRGVYRSK